MYKIIQRTVCLLTLLCLFSCNVNAEEADLFVIDNFNGLQRNPSADKIADRAHERFDNVYLKDNNIQVVKGRDRLNSSAHADTVVNGFWIYETPNQNGDCVNCELLLHMNGTDATTTFTDSTASPKTVTIEGNAQIDTAQSKFSGASGLFDGTGDRLRVADSADWTMGSAYTIDFWLRFNTTTNTTLVGQFVDANNLWKLWTNSTNEIRFRQVAGGVADIDLTWTWTPVINTWYHVELVKDASDYEVFIDGTSLGTQSDATSIVDLGQGLQVAGDTIAPTSLDGWMDELRIDKGNSAHTANFTPPTTEYVLVSDTPVQKYVVAESDELVTYNFDGTTRTVIASGVVNDTWDAVQVGTALYLTSIENGIYKWLGTSTAVLKVSPSTGYKFISTYKGFLFSAYKRSLWFSNAIGSSEIDDETWGASDHILVGSAQHYVTGLAPSSDSLIIFTDGSIQELTGFGSSTFRLKNISDSVGCINNNTIEQDQNGDLIFFAGLAGVFKLRVGRPLTDSSAGTIIDQAGNSITKLSSGLDDVFRGIDEDIDLTPSDYTSSHAYYDSENNLYFLYIGQDAFIYDNTSNTWSHLPATKIFGSDYLLSQVDNDSKPILIDNLGFFYDNWLGYENGIESGSVTGAITASTSTTLTCGACTFNTTNDGLKGLWVFLDNENGEYRQISSNTGTQLTVTSAWTTNPITSDSFYVAYIRPNVLTKQYSFNKPPQSSLSREFWLIHNKSAATQNISLFAYEDKSTTPTNDDDTFNLASDFVNKISQPVNGYWLQFGYEAFIYNTSNTVVPPLDIISYAIKVDKEEEA